MLLSPRPEFPKEVCLMGKPFEELTYNVSVYLDKKITWCWVSTLCVSKIILKSATIKLVKYILLLHLFFIV